MYVSSGAMINAETGYCALASDVLNSVMKCMEYLLLNWSVKQEFAVVLNEVLSFLCQRVIQLRTSTLPITMVVSLNDEISLWNI